MKRKFPPKFRRKPSNQPCGFCTGGSSPDYKNPDLGKYISSRGRITARLYTGVCQKHQRRLSVAIKQARHLALLPFASGV